MTQRRELLEYELDPRALADVVSGKTGGSALPRRGLPTVIPVLLAAATAAIVATGVIAILAWPGLPGPGGVVPVLGLAFLAGAIAGRLLQRRVR